MNIWWVLLAMVGIGGCFMVLFELSKRNEGIRIITPCIILGGITAAIKSPSGNLIVNILTYAAVYVFVYICINAYKHVIESELKEKKNTDL